jgi:TRAP-type C4-dicarboxylate transport system substrate-binding protein
MKTWAEVPTALQPKLIEAAQSITDSMAQDIVKGDEEAIAIMLKYGLKITPPQKQAAQEWEEMVQKGFSMMIGRSYDRQSYDMAKGYLDEYLAAHPRR